MPMLLAAANPMFSGNRIRARSGQRVAIAWVVARGVVPIIGPKSVAQLEDNLAAAELRLTGAQLALLDAASAPSLGFPHDMLNELPMKQSLEGGQLDLFDWPPGMVA